MSTIIGIDGGSEKSAWCRIVDGLPETWGWEPNDDLLERLRQPGVADVLVIEAVIARGGTFERQQVFDTVFANGRFVEAFSGRWAAVGNSEHSGHICGDARANDSMRRRCLIERFGGDRVVYGVKCGKCKQAGKIRGAVTCGDCESGFTNGVRGLRKCPTCKGRSTVIDYATCPTCNGTRWEVLPSGLAGLSGPGMEHIFSAIAVGLTFLDKHSGDA